MPETLDMRLAAFAASLRGVGAIRSEPIERAFATVQRHRCVCRFHYGPKTITVPTLRTGVGWAGAARRAVAGTGSRPMVDALCRCEREREVGAALSGLIRDLHTTIAAGRDVADLLGLAIWLHTHATCKARRLHPTHSISPQPLIQLSHRCRVVPRLQPPPGSADLTRQPCRAVLGGEQRPFANNSCCFLNLAG